MNVSRRQFFKGLGAAIGLCGLHGVLKDETCSVAERRPSREGKVDIECLGHSGLGKHR
jgi:hypothetical protein